MTLSVTRKSLAIRLLHKVFSIYLLIAVLITLTQMFNEYLREQTNVKKTLVTAEAIFADNLTTAIWNFDTTELNAQLANILKLPKVVGVKIEQMDRPSDWQRPFSIRLGTILDDQDRIVTLGQHELKHSFYLQLISHHFQLRKDNLLLGDVTFYSSNAVVFNAVKYDFLAVMIAGVVKTILLWLLFTQAFNLLLGKYIRLFCKTMNRADIDQPDTIFLNLKTDNIEEFDHIKCVFNDLFKRVLDRKQQLDELNDSLEQKLTACTQELEQAHHKLLELSITDSLTGLANRRHFDDVLIKECLRAERAGHPLALLMIDVDEFKTYNNHYGHQAGDQCLADIASVLKSHVHRVGDLAARYGGEEFSFIAPATAEHNAMRLANRICTELANKKLPHDLSSLGIITVSIGVATYTIGEAPEILINKADQALYYAKQQGRNCVVFYKEKM